MNGRTNLCQLGIGNYSTCVPFSKTSYKILKLKQARVKRYL